MRPGDLEGFGAVGTNGGGVLADLDTEISYLEENSMVGTAYSLRHIRTKLYALVEAAKPFDLNVNSQLDDLHPMRGRHSAREYRAMYAALREIEQ